MKRVGVTVLVIGAVAIALPQRTSAETAIGEITKNDPKLVSPIIHKLSSHALAPKDVMSVLTKPNSDRKEGKEKVLLIRLNFKDTPFIKDEGYYNNLLFGSGDDTLNSWLQHQSCGKFGVEPLEVKDSKTPGVLTVDIDANKYPGINAKDYDKQDAILNQVIQDIKDKLPADVLAKADKNNDKNFKDGWLLDDGSEPEELTMFFVFSGNEKQGNQPKVWPHLTSLNTDINGYGMHNAVLATSELVDGNFVGASVLIHEFCHSLSARDMYADEISVGPWSIMDKCYANRQHNSYGQDPNPLDPFHKSIFGWADEHRENPKSEMKFEFDKRNKYLVLQDPSNSDIEYYFEYRDFNDTYEKSNFRYGVTDSGVIVWKFNRNALPKDWADKDWKLNTQGPRTSLYVLTNDKSDMTVANSLHRVGTHFKLNELPMEFTVSEKALTVKPVENTKPVSEPIINAKNLSIKVNDKFDPKVGVTATDEENKDITCEIKVVENTVNPAHPGNYIVVYQITTSKGKTIAKRIDVKVEGEVKPIGKPIIGVTDRSIKVGAKFNPLEGISAKDGEGKDITGSLKVEENTVNTSKPGNYAVVVSVTDSHGQTVTKPFIVTVTEDVKPQPIKDTTPPTIVGLEDVVLKVGDKFNPLEGLSVTDNWDKNPKLDIIENTVNTSKPGAYVVVYQATDASNNKKIESIKVVVEPKKDVKPLDKEPPKIKVPDRCVPLGTHLDLRIGVTAIDNIDGDVTGQIQIDKGDLNLNKIGTYNVKYAVADKAGNIGSVIGKVVVYSNKPTIEGSDIVIKTGTDFKPMQGIRAYDIEDGDLTPKIKVDATTVDTSKSGVYKVKYSVTDSEKQTTEFVRRVNVVDNVPAKSPIPSLLFTDKVVRGNNLNIAIKDKFNPLSYVKASDDEDGDLTKDVKVIDNNVSMDKVGTYTITYEVKDKKDNRAVKLLKVHVLPNAFNNVVGEAPMIDAHDTVVKVGTKFNPKSGVIALDKVDGDITDKVVVSHNNVDTSRPGTYKVTYTVVDSDKHVTDKTITVTVSGPGMTDDVLNVNDKSNKTNNSKEMSLHKDKPSSVLGKDNPGLIDKTKTLGNSVAGAPIPIPSAIKKLVSKIPATGNYITSFVAPVGVIMACVVYKLITRFRRK